MDGPDNTFASDSYLLVYLKIKQYMRPRNGPSMSNAGVRMFGLPDFKSFRKKRRVSIGDVILWSESGEETYQGKSAKKRYRKRKHSHNPKGRRTSSSKARIRLKKIQLRALKLKRRQDRVKLAKLRKKTARLVHQRAQRLERILHEIKHGKPKKRTINSKSKTPKPNPDVNVMSKLELIQSILWKRKGKRG